MGLLQQSDCSNIHHSLQHRLLVSCIFTVRVHHPSRVPRSEALRVNEVRILHPGREATNNGPS
eukprot:6925214-Lingulodinium_polyedra.AAC.1